METALARRPDVPLEGVLSFSADGTITWKINVGTFAAGGTIPSGKAARLAGEWTASADHEDAGKIKVGELHIWGLAKAFRKLGVRIGDRITLQFDTKTRQVRVLKSRSEEIDET